MNSTVVKKKNIFLKISLFLLLASQQFSVLAFEEQRLINFAVLANNKVKEQAYRDKVDEFEMKNPSIKIKLIRLTSNNYPDLLNEVLAIKDEIDIINWFAGVRLNTLIDENLIVNINDYWTYNDLDKVFSKTTKDEVIFNSDVYGLPITSYVWGFYYKKSLFKRLNLTTPSTWEAFIEVLDVLKSKQISPIALGTKFPWQIAGWFDYLMLRIHGAEIYQQLVKGELSYTSKEVLLVFKYWQELLNKQYIFAQHRFFDGDALMPLLYREVVGVNLIGSFALSNLPMNYQEDIGFFPFPTILGHEDNSVLAPLSVISVTKNGINDEGVHKLLSFFAKEETQTYINKQLSTIPPINTAIPDARLVIQQTFDLLQNAKFHSQYFDLEVKFNMAEFAKKQFSDFVTHKNIKKVTEALEAKRVDFYDISKP